MRKYLLFGLLLFTSVAHAQTQASIALPTAKVFANPTSKSDVLVVLKKGSKVEVAGVTDSGWAKVKVTVSGFQFEGWVVKSALGKSKAAPAPKAAVVRAPAPQPKATPQPSPKMTNTSSTQLEQFFEPSGGSSAATPAPAPEPVARVEESKPSRDRSSSSSSSGDSTWRSDKLILSASPGYLFHQYTFSDATKDAFRYNVAGAAITLGAEYKAFDFFDDLIRFGATFNGMYAMLNTKTNLLDGTNTKFSDLTAANRMMDLTFKLKLMFNFDRMVSKPFLIGLSAGYEYMKFFGDDIIDDNSAPVGLFVDQTTTSIPVGVIAELHFLDPVTMTISADVLMKNKASEKPAGSSGTNPNAKLGFAPTLSLNFPIVGHHFMGIKYAYRIQETTFTGPSSSRVNNVLNAATVLQTTHLLGLEYDYHF